MEQNTRLTKSKIKFLKSTQLFIIAATILLSLLITILCIGFLMRYEVDNDISSLNSVTYWNDKLAKEQEIWFQKGIEELKTALNLRVIRRQAKNVVVFMATGIDREVIAAARLDGFMNATTMSWDRFPHLGMLQHSCANISHCDPLSMATALFGGVKTNSKLGGLDAKVSAQNCTAAANPSHHIKSILKLAQEAGKRTGFVTTGRVTAAIPAALYAHVADSKWECNASMMSAKLSQGCRDIATELLASATGQHINVVMGGGRQALVANVPATIMDPLDDRACNSNERRNLMRDWRKQKIVKQKTFAVLQHSADLERFNGTNIDYALGIFANGNLQYRYKNMPGLKHMVRKAIAVLNRPDQGYFMLVNADAEYNTEREEEMKTLLDLNAAIEETLKSIKDGIDNILVIVLFKSRLQGVEVKSSAEIEKITYIQQDEKCLEQLLEDVVSDTVMYAQGPKAYLFDGLHDETYLAHAISYAMEMGPFKKKRGIKTNKLF